MLYIYIFFNIYKKSSNKLINQYQTNGQQKPQKPPAKNPKNSRPPKIPCTRNIDFSIFPFPPVYIYFFEFAIKLKKN